jgi:GTP cyclohydrolase I
MNEASVEKAIRDLIEWAGDDPTREGLRDTPLRVVKAYKEWFSGYTKNPDYIISSSSFSETENYDQMIILRDIEFFSHCEHHLCPIVGTATVAYLPTNKVVGISKIARVVECYARRLQIQERLTQQIATCLMDSLEPLGVGVRIKAKHMCMTSRGVNCPSTEMVTCSLLGAFRKQEVRTEFLELAGSK